MPANSVWNGKVYNRSNKWIICLWDEKDDKGNKVWKGKALGPGRRSPYLLDVDGAKAVDNTVTISQWSEWWWLGRGAEVNIKGTGQDLIITDISLSGTLSKVSNADVNGWGPSIDTSQDLSWGERIIL